MKIELFSTKAELCEWRYIDALSSSFPYTVLLICVLALLQSEYDDSEYVDSMGVWVIVVQKCLCSVQTVSEFKPWSELTSRFMSVCVHALRAFSIDHTTAFAM